MVLKPASTPGTTRNPLTKGSHAVAGTWEYGGLPPLCWQRTFRVTLIWQYRLSRESAPLPARGAFS